MYVHISSTIIVIPALQSLQMQSNQKIIVNYYCANIIRILRGSSVLYRPGYPVCFVYVSQSVLCHSFSMSLIGISKYYCCARQNFTSHCVSCTCIYRWLAAYSAAASFRYSHYFVSFLSQFGTLIAGIGCTSNYCWYAKSAFNICYAN